MTNEKVDEAILIKKLEEYKKQIADLEKAKDDVLQKCSVLDTILDSLPHPFYIVNAKDYSISLANKAALHGQPIEKQTCYELTHHRESPCTSCEHPCPLEQVKKTKKPAIVEHIHYNNEGKPIYVEVYGYPIFDAEGNVVEMIEYSIDITKRKDAEKKLSHMATHDSLTQLPNRALFNIRLDLELAHSQRSNNILAVMLLDLDGFKNVNDSFGHSIGDMLLKEVSVLLQKLLRKSDTVARMGGDEFLFLLPELHEESDADIIAGKIINILRKPIEIEGHILEINSSIGISTFPNDSDNRDKLISYADTAMYSAKKAGGGEYKKFSNIK